MDSGVLQSHAHGMIVHFPVALLITTLVLELLALYKPWQDRLRHAAFATLILGTLGAAAAVISGPDFMLRSSPLGHTHENFADLTLILFGALSVWRLFAFWRNRHLGVKLVGVYLALVCVGVGLVGYTGYLGGTMVYESAVGVRNNGQLVNPPAAFGRQP